MDWPLQDNAHGKASKRACSFSPEENDCDISIYPFSLDGYKSPQYLNGLKTRILSIKILAALDKSKVMFLYE